jgi:ABC-type Fe3+/spermidine/putrescine transport system ATPase subunit
LPDSSPDEPIVELKNVHRNFGDVAAVDGVDLRVTKGEFLAFLGPSGCGKTTLLRIIAGFEQADRGEVRVAGAEVSRMPPEKRPLNMVFQRYALFPHLTVEDNVAFGLKLEKRSSKEVKARVAEMLELVQLSHLARRHPNQISGGQAQRVALARALARGPEVLLLDEPLTALDRAVRSTLQDQLKAIQLEVGTTFIYVTHDQEEAMAMSTRIALMNAGRIDQLATPNELYRSPGSSFAASFVGDANILDCVVSDNGTPALLWKGQRLERDLSGAGGRDEVRVMIRPEDVELTTEGSGATGSVTGSTFHGFYWMHELDIDGDQLVAREITEQPSVAVGQTVAVSVDVRRAAILPD